MLIRLIDADGAEVLLNPVHIVKLDQVTNVVFTDDSQHTCLSPESMSKLVSLYMVE